MGWISERCSNFSGTKVIGDSVYWGIYRRVNLESVEHESGLVDGTFAGGAAVPWSA